MRGGGG
ncbi:hypothetical protein CP01DC11_0627A, partial [Chlamydia psittaci 01DC11]